MSKTLEGYAPIAPYNLSYVHRSLNYDIIGANHSTRCSSFGNPSRLNTIKTRLLGSPLPALVPGMMMKGTESPSFRVSGVSFPTPQTSDILVVSPFVRFPDRHLLACTYPKYPSQQLLSHRIFLSPSMHPSTHLFNNYLLSSYYGNTGRMKLTKQFCPSFHDIYSLVEGKRQCLKDQL